MNLLVLAILMICLKPNQIGSMAAKKTITKIKSSKNRK